MEELLEATCKDIDSGMLFHKLEESALKKLMEFGSEMINFTASELIKSINGSCSRTKEMRGAKTSNADSVWEN